MRWLWTGTFCSPSRFQIKGTMIRKTWDSICRRLRPVLPWRLRTVLVWIFVGLLAVMQGCRQEEPRAVDDLLLASAYSGRLYASDIPGIVPKGSLPEDSMRIVKRYVDNWVRQQVFLHHATNNLDLAKMDFEKKIQDYKNSLIIFAYETELVRNDLDTLVTEAQVSEYYEQNHLDFKLQESIVRVVYVKVPLDAPELGVLRRLYRSGDPDDIALLEDYCVQHAANYFIEPDNWLLFSELLREIPLPVSNPESYLTQNRHVELTDEYYRYLLNIQDYKLKGSVSPLSFERENVRSILLNRRRHAFVNQKREEFFQQALQSGSLETFF